MGVCVLNNENFESAIKQGTMMKIRVAGMLKLSEDVRPELKRELLKVQKSMEL
ncbi:hypothetical protein GTO27_07455 [Candidatus Bathyarchaeota archaeon]|nr:hypothetical protein [Candidatus Bathyarchaeota archaeon]